MKRLIRATDYKLEKHERTKYKSKLRSSTSKLLKEQFGTSVTINSFKYDFYGEDTICITFESDSFEGRVVLAILGDYNGYNAIEINGNYFGSWGNNSQFSENEFVSSQTFKNDFVPLFEEYFQSIGLGKPDKPAELRVNPKQSPMMVAVVKDLLNDLRSQVNLPFSDAEIVGSIGREINHSDLSLDWIDLSYSDVCGLFLGFRVTYHYVNEYAFKLYDIESGSSCWESFGRRRLSVLQRKKDSGNWFETESIHVNKESYPEIFELPAYKKLYDEYY